MSVIFVLIGCSLLLGCSFLIAFLYASKSGQFEDDYTPSVRILFEDESMTRTDTSDSISSADKYQKETQTKPSNYVRK